MTQESFVCIKTVIGVVIAAFSLGYRLGRDKRHDDKNTRE